MTNSQPNHVFSRYAIIAWAHNFSRIIGAMSASIPWCLLLAYCQPHTFRFGTTLFGPKPNSPQELHHLTALLTTVLIPSNSLTSIQLELDQQTTVPCIQFWRRYH
ncbi:hypothetical protein RSAG8_05926, partial [Rhizoctonia solani AG-8 WAC10335]